MTFRKHPCTGEWCWMERLHRNPERHDTFEWHWFDMTFPPGIVPTPDDRVTIDGWQWRVVR